MASAIVPTEEWRAVVGYEGWYEVSSLGRVRSIKLRQGARLGVLRLSRNRHGYLYVWLCRSRVNVCVKIHRLVAAAFIGKLSGKLEVNHLNGVKDDNRVENLDITTRSENMRHRYQVLGIEGGCLKFSKLTPADVVAIRERRANGERVMDLAREFGVSRDSISKVVNRHHWKHLA